MKIYKIASFEITDVKLIDYIASKKKPIIISTGNAEINEVKEAIKVIKKYHNQIIILHCISSYTTLIENTNLKKILELKKIFKNNLIGLSDHTDNIYSSIAAISHGIVAIEKHYKLNHKTKTVDSSFSITPSELNTLSLIKNKIFKSMNESRKTYIDKETIKLRRSIFAIKDIKKGEKLSLKNIDTFRPKIGISSSKFFEILGKKVRLNIKKFEPIKKNYLR